MRSSTSSSDRLDARRAAALLLLALMVYFAALESAMRVVIPVLSNSAQRERSDFASALGLTPGETPEAERLLLVGNSLLLHGVDRKALTGAMPSTYSVAVLPVENTSYWDWYFGLRRLFNAGSRPTVVVLTMNLRQLVSDATNGEQFAHTLMERADLFKVVQASHLDNTTASAYYFATFSSWLGGRSGFRNWLLERWLPGADGLVERLVPANQSSPPVDMMLSTGSKRLTDLQRLCASYGARFVFVLPATRNASDPGADLAAAVPAGRPDIVMPFRPGEMPAEAFSDGFHLNAQGATRFTARLAPMLVTALERD